VTEYADDDLRADGGATLHRITVTTPDAEDLPDVFLPDMPRSGENIRLSDGTLVNVVSVTWLVGDEPTRGAPVAEVEGYVVPEVTET
jgi:hypothetical protein